MKCRRGHTTYLVYLWGFDNVLAKGECNELRVLDAKSPDRQKAGRLDRPMEIKWRAQTHRCNVPELQV